MIYIFKIKKNFKIISKEHISGNTYYYSTNKKDNGNNGHISHINNFFNVSNKFIWLKDFCEIKNIAISTALMTSHNMNGQVLYTPGKNMIMLTFNVNFNEPNVNTVSMHLDGDVWSTIAIDDTINYKRLY